MQKKHTYLPASFSIMADTYIKYKALYFYILHIFSMNRQKLESWKILFIYLKKCLLIMYSVQSTIPGVNKHSIGKDNLQLTFMEPTFQWKN